jgi:hypothetical protein
VSQEAILRYNSTSSNTATTINLVKSAKANPTVENDAIKQTNNLISETLNKEANESGFFNTSRRYKTNKSIQQDPFTYASEFVVSDKIAGRSINVSNHDLDRAINQLDSLVRSNKLKDLSANQRFFVKPNKRRLAKKVANRKRVFESGIAKLFEVVRDAVRKGY